MKLGYKGLFWAARHHLGLEWAVVPVQQINFITFE
jgi:hypothetical protein